VACGRGMHADCPHIFGAGGGFNLRRLRPEFGVGLCPCDCHAPCPLPGREKVAGWLITVPARAWLESCTCPGAEAERTQWEAGGFGAADLDAVWARHHQRGQCVREAFNAAKAQSVGKSREEIKKLYVAELSARSLEIPAPEILDANIAALKGNPLPSARLMGRATVGLVKDFRNLWRGY
jgi:hypothetical protein